jgi:hypothetical protein
MWQLSYGKPKTINSPVEIDGTRKQDNQGNEISRIRVHEPSLYLESADSLGHHSFVIEEFPGIHQNVEHKSREAVGQVLQLKDHDKFWLQYFLCSNFGPFFVDKDVVYCDQELDSHLLKVNWDKAEHYISKHDKES